MTNGQKGSSNSGRVTRQRQADKVSQQLSGNLSFKIKKSLCDCRVLGKVFVRNRQKQQKTRESYGVITMESTELYCRRTRKLD